jgi:hypothetical protein
MYFECLPLVCKDWSSKLISYIIYTKVVFKLTSFAIGTRTNKYLISYLAQSFGYSWSLVLGHL